MTLYCFKENNTTLYHFNSKWYDFRIFQSKYAGSGNNYKQFYDISKEIL